MSADDVSNAWRLGLAIARSVVNPVGGVVDAAMAVYGTSHESDPPQAPRKNANPVFELRDVHDEEDPLGSEVRLIDNGGSDSTLTRVITATREWRRSVMIGGAKTVAGSAGATLGFDAVGLKASIEATLRENYSHETETKQVFSETITISVPPRTSIRIVLSWKALVRSGIVRVTDTDGSVNDVPYRVITGVTFDQTTKDLPDS